MKMNKPCEHCNKSDKSKQDYFKCDNPCNQAKRYREEEREILNDLKNSIQNVINIIEQNESREREANETD